MVGTAPIGRQITTTLDVAFDYPLSVAGHRYDILDSGCDFPIDEM